MVKKLRLMKKSYCQPNYFVRLKPLLTQISSASFFNDARHGWVGLGCCIVASVSLHQLRKGLIVPWKLPLKLDSSS